MTADEFKLQPDDVQERVLDHNRTCLVDWDDWWDCVYDAFKEEMAAVGITVDEMYFSGFWSQGDGACFEGRVSDFKKLFAVAEFSKYVGKHKIVKDCAFSIGWVHRGRYYHQHSLDYASEWTDPDTNDDNPLREQLKIIEAGDAENLMQQLEDEIPEFVRAQCSKLYKQLEEEYESLTSDEAIIDHLEINERLAEEVAEARQHLGIDEDEEEHEPDHTGA